MTRYNKQQEFDVHRCSISIVFKIGDEQSYSGYLNGTLDSDSYYGLFMTGITKTKSGVS